MADLMEMLEKQKQEGLQSYVTTWGSKIDKVFVQMEDGFRDWALGGDDNVLLFDPTHGTNRYGMKLCAFVSVSGSGQTIILALSLLDIEDHLSMEWAFLCFAKCFRRPPRVFFRTVHRRSSGHF
jgi:hypothetical protein